jgi:hypothetical protein
MSIELHGNQHKILVYVGHDRWDCVEGCIQESGVDLDLECAGLISVCWSYCQKMPSPQYFPIEVFAGVLGDLHGQRIRNGYSLISAYQGLRCKGPHQFAFSDRYLYLQLTFVC